MTDSNDKCERSTALADATGSASEAIVYAGKHYGRKHRILFDTGNLLTLIHEPSGDTLTVHGCDVERVTQNDQGEPQPPTTGVADRKNV